MKVCFIVYPWTTKADGCATEWTLTPRRKNDPMIVPMSNFGTSFCDSMTVRPCP